jgi:glycosyltransferase involved in cell wall biosynthesis
LENLKTAIVHEWFVNYAGSERVVESLTNIWPNADVFALVDFLDDKQRQIILKGKHAHTSIIQKLPFARKKHRNYLPLFPFAVERLNLSGYDLIISSSHAVAKGIKTKPDQLHISYCHSPMRYAWDNSKQYLAEANADKGIKGILANSVINYLRKWDLATSVRPNYLIANSNFIAGKLKRIYHRQATVIYPPVDVDKFTFKTEKENYYLTASRMVPYKRIDLVVSAFSQLPDKKLFVVGNGPEFDKIKKNASQNIELLGYREGDDFKKIIANAKAFVFAAEEDFGITIVEAMACGTPVIALNKGGTTETAVDGKTGILFDSQNTDSIKKAVLRFEEEANTFNPREISDHAKQFSRKIFEDKIKKYVQDKSVNFFNKDKAFEF